MKGLKLVFRKFLSTAILSAIKMLLRVGRRVASRTAIPAYASAGARALAFQKTCPRYGGPDLPVGRSFRKYFARGKASGMSSTTPQVPAQLDPAPAGSIPAASVAKEEFFSGRGGIDH